MVREARPKPRVMFRKPTATSFVIDRIVKEQGSAQSGPGPPEAGEVDYTH